MKQHPVSALVALAAVALAPAFFCAGFFVRGWVHHGQLGLLPSSAESGHSSSALPDVPLGRIYSLILFIALVLLAPILLGLLGQGVVRMAVLPVIRVFARDERTRRGFVVVGAALLASGLLFQLVATS